MGRLYGTRTAEVRAWSDVDASGHVIVGSSTAPSALHLIPMYGATRLIADQVASAPLRAYFPSPDGARRQLSTQPALLRAPGMFAWKFQAMTSLLLWGNAYGLIVSRDANQVPTAIVWLPPQSVRCDGDGMSSPTFSLKGKALPSEDVVHIPAYVVPGQAAGLSPISAFRLNLETGYAAQQYARDWYDGGGIPAAVVKNTARTVSGEEAAKIKARIKATLKNGEPFVTGSDWDYKTVGTPSSDARWVETMKLTATQVATIYGVPPEKIGGEVGSSLTYSTLEQNQQNLATETVRPWAVRLEDALTSLYAGRTYVRFNLDAGIRADLKSRMEAHEIALRIGLETQGEGRAREESPPLTPEQVADWQLWNATVKGAGNAAPK